MVAKNARDVLSKENELLDALIKKASDFATAVGGIDAEIANSWADYFKRHRDVNEQLIKEKDPQVFDKKLKEEIGQLKSMRDAHAGSDLHGKASKAAHGDDIRIAEKLL
jgi:hypothetical protein